MTPSAPAGGTTIVAGQVRDHVRRHAVHAFGINEMVAAGARRGGAENRQGHHGEYAVAGGFLVELGFQRGEPGGFLGGEIVRFGIVGLDVV